ncbi:SDR family NAD(P)-dependent oxidoreductase [Candidatus Nitronereus thalassa]|uniref:SDR family NAD(P)-dependent oxidoreductase n=1 Tax=Candidatus Nitronereus thalassa TaxID=3020898 RepID=A0ABU3K3U1_9BACT|nr:SDR family NAD(P)-dependent oxidoreductase [Candidatus Nitronereus thalassa]MDT7041057.1 SDR family NAD(P)-dependent oxidoreductase [Candidatus Nitronereus thalassa]
MNAHNSNSTIDPKTVLVMGGSGVIGGAICMRFAEMNWKVGIHYHQHDDSAKKIYAHFYDQEETHSLYHADVQDPQQVANAINRFMEHWGKIDVLIWSVGETKNLATIRTSPEQWNTLIQINLTGLFFCLRQVGSIFHNQGYGSVLVVSSLASTQGDIGQTAYAATKAGILGLIRSAAHEWGKSNICVNAVFPGWHPSILSGDAFPSPETLNDHLLGRTPNLRETADHIFHLATSKDISGQCFNLDSRIW